VRYRVLAERARVQEAAMSRGFDDVRVQLRAAHEELNGVARRLEKRMEESHASARRRFDATACRLSPARMSSRVLASRVRLALLRSGVETAARGRLDEARARVAVAAASLDALSPLAVLGRGYALASNARGAILRKANSVGVGEQLRVRLAAGALLCRVEEVEGVEEH